MLGDNIIIPPSHIISSVKYVTILEKSFIDFFDNGTLITSYYKGQRDIKDFIQKKKEDAVLSTKFYRCIGIERIIINMEAKNHPFGSFCLILKNVIQEGT